MRFAVFRLSYKVHKIQESKDIDEHTYTLTFKDGIGNKLEARGTEQDFEGYDVGDALKWDLIIRQKTLEED